MLAIRSLYGDYSRGTESPVRVVQSLLGKIEGSGSRLNSFITVLRKDAIRQAEESEKRFNAGHPIGPLDGIPIAVKDLFYIAGVRCTAGSKILAEHVATYDSTAVARLKKAGAVLIGTTNMHEFASGVTGDNPHFGAVRNPWNLEADAGGSSSGSAAAVASGLSAASLGTDTAGSVRIPASACGVVGLKPTYGRISRLGVVPLASSFDTVGTLTSCAWDSATLLSTLAGHEQEDLTTASAPVEDYAEGIDGAFAGLKVGAPRKYFHEVIDPDVEGVFSAFVTRLASLGCTVRETELAGIESINSCWRTIRLAEATAFHLHWLETAPGSYGQDVRVMLEEGLKVTAVDYVTAQNLRPSLMQEFANSMSDVDVVVVPSTAIVAPKIGETEVEIGGKSVAVRTALIRQTLPFNVVGFPSISVPVGLSRGLPVGAQMVAKPFEEAKLLAMAAAWENTNHYPSPPLTF